jgi:uncharacterized membrane protein
MGFAGIYVAGGVYFVVPPVYTSAELRVIGFMTGSSGSCAFNLYDLTHGAVTVGGTITFPYTQITVGVYTASLTIGSSNGHLRSDGAVIYQLNAVTSGSCNMSLMGAYIDVG